MPNIWIDLPLSTGAGGVNVEDGGSPILSPALTLNFTGNVTVTDSGSTATINIPFGSSTDSFVHMQPITGTTPTAATSTDTLIFASSDSSISIIGNSSTDTLNFQSNLIWTAPLSQSGHTVSMTQANTSTNGWLSSTDWNTFNSKGNGSVTSVSLTAPSFLTVSGSPVTTSGTLALALASQTANTVFAAPNGSSGTPSFRLLVAADIPSLSGLYLPLTGGTMSGAINMGNNQIGNISQLAIGEVNPSATTSIDIVNTTGATQRIVQTGYSGQVGLRGRYANGTLGTPTAAVSGNILNFISGLGYGTSQFATSSTGALNIVAGETFTNTSNATYLQFSITPTGSVTTAEAMRVNSTGNVLIGTTTDSGTQKLQVNGNSNVGTVTAGVWNGTATSGQSFITSGTTYTTPAGITTNTVFKFTLIGGGGGGTSGNSASQHSSGGGSGAGLILFITGLAPSTAYTIAIGAAGTGAASGAVGGAGGNTTLTIPPTTYTAGGGSGAAVISSVGGLGGTATNGTINITGGQGGATATVLSSAGMPGANSAFGFGFGGQGLAASATGNGNPGVGFGAGGGGSSSNGAPTGGAGTAGCMLVEWKN